MHDKKPALIAQCSGVADVIASVNFARENDILVSVRGGGHNVGGSASNDGGLMIDLSQMKGIRVDLEKKTVYAQGGVTIADLDRETSVFGLVAPSGVVSTTGIAGLTLVGGLGHLQKRYGLSIDNLVSVDVVTADGQFITACEKQKLRPVLSRAWRRWKFWRGYFVPVSSVPGWAIGNFVCAFLPCRRSPGNLTGMAGFYG